MQLHLALYFLSYLNSFFYPNGILVSSPNQFGFKPGHSTTLCSWVLKEIVNLFILKCSVVFACFLDCSKAFDLVDHELLFNKLRQRNIPDSYLRLLSFAYSNQVAFVQWGNTISFDFFISNGVRQGGILSPHIFACYIDDLVDRLRMSNAGCWFGLQFYGILAYADDLV